MLIAPVEIINHVGTFLAQAPLSDRLLLSDPTCPKGLCLQETPVVRPTSHDSVSALSPDTFGDLSMNASVTESVPTMPSNVTFQHLRD